MDDHRIECPYCFKKITEGIPFCPYCGKEQPQTLNKDEINKNPYKILQVSEDAEQEVIDAAYRSLARKYHPDGGTPSVSEERMREINWAHGILSDPYKLAEWKTKNGKKQTPKSSVKVQSSTINNPNFVNERQSPTVSKSPSPRPTPVTSKNISTKDSPWPWIVLVIVFLFIGAIIALVGAGNILQSNKPSVPQESNTAVAAGYTSTKIVSVPQDLVTACKSEGMLTIIATPPDWANYGEIFADFEKTSGVKINSLDPNAGSADELAAIEANKGNKGLQAPDIVDVGYAYGDYGASLGYYQPYKVSTWDKIPDTVLGIPAKDPNGYWIGGYYGVMAIIVNTAVVQNVPTNWSDLLKPEYKGQVALAGDPRSSNQAIQAVLAASLANGGSLDNAQPGLDFFNQVNQAGNFVPVIAKPGTITQGATPIAFFWDYNAFGYKYYWNGNPPITIVYPSPTIASMYVQAISAYAPHPNCAKLWMEILHSDEGQLAFMKGYSHGIQQADLESRGVIPANLKAYLPPTSDFSSAVSPTPDQLSAALTLIRGGWMSTVGVDIPTPVP